MCPGGAEVWGELAPAPLDSFEQGYLFDLTVDGVSTEVYGASAALVRVEGPDCASIETLVAGPGSVDSATQASLVLRLEAQTIELGATGSIEDHDRARLVVILDQAVVQALGWTTWTVEALGPDELEVRFEDGLSCPHDLPAADTSACTPFQEASLTLTTPQVTFDPAPLCFTDGSTLGGDVCWAPGEAEEGPGLPRCP